jgi:DNA repair protein RecO (recombination protein O)
MTLLATDAIVLHVLDYSETSRIFRLATREAGMISALARGARRSRARYGSALGLFAEGIAQLSMREHRDLQTLAGFEVTRSHSALASDLERFSASSAIAELVLRFGTGEGAAALYDVLSDSLIRIADAVPADAREAGLSAAWHLVAELGFTPALAHCASCHEETVTPLPLPFSSSAGGVLCDRCVRLHPSTRALPADARGRIQLWCEGDRGQALPIAAARAHQRLLREFVAHHLADGRPLRAFDSWERGALDGG